MQSSSSVPKTEQTNWAISKTWKEIEGNLSWPQKTKQRETGLGTVVEINKLE